MYEYVTDFQMDAGEEVIGTLVNRCHLFSTRTLNALLDS